MSTFQPVSPISLADITFSLTLGISSYFAQFCITFALHLKFLMKDFGREGSNTFYFDIYQNVQSCQLKIDGNKGEIHDCCQYIGLLAMKPRRPFTRWVTPPYLYIVHQHLWLEV